MSNFIIGLDPSITHFGWVVLDQENGSLVDSGTFKTTPKSGLLVQRLILQRERLKALLEKYGVSFISMEAPYFMDFNTELLFALNQFLHEVFLNSGCFVVYIQPLVLKKFAVPEIKNVQEITKSHISHQAKKELGLSGKIFSEHVSDAYFAGRIGWIFYRWNFLKTLKDGDLSDFLQHFFFGKHLYTRGIKKGITEYTGLIYKENDQFFDYRKNPRKTDTLIKEVHNGTKKVPG